MIAASSALLRLNGTAAAAGPLLAGSLMAAFGPSAYFVTLGSLTGALTIYDLWRKTRRKPVPAAGNTVHQRAAAKHDHRPELS